MTTLWGRKIFTVCICALLCGLALPALADDAIKQAPARPLPAMTRAERLLLLDNVAELWRLRIAGISEGAPDGTYVELFGKVENGQLAPQFVALASLMTLIRSLPAGAAFPRGQQNGDSGAAGALQRRFNNVPSRYDLFLLESALKQTALERLGWPFQKKALAVLSDAVKEAPDGLFVDTKTLCGPGGIMASARKNPVFAVPTNLYSDDGTWFMDGDVREMAAKSDGILHIAAFDRFHLRTEKTGGHWRILSLTFDATPIR